MFHLKKFNHCSWTSFNPIFLNFPSKWHFSFNDLLTLKQKRFEKRLNKSKNKTITSFGVKLNIGRPNILLCFYFAKNPEKILVQSISATKAKKTPTLLVQPYYQEILAIIDMSKIFYQICNYKDARSSMLVLLYSTGWEDLCHLSAGSLYSREWVPCSM